MSTDAAVAALDETASRLGAALGVDGPALLRERMEILGIAPAGTMSAGGTCRLLRARDGWIAVNLARRSDVELLAAWFERDWDGAPWDAIAAHVGNGACSPLVERAQLLGIPAAVAVEPPSDARPVTVRAGAPATSGRVPVVADLSAMWAGPLCGRLLGQCVGARVVKVELAERPDGARFGPPELFERMNGGKEQLVLQSDEVRALVGEVDVVITSARPRAVEHLGLALDLAQRAHDDGLVWIAITGYGYDSAWRDRVAFGDDAAVAGGLAVAAGGFEAPVFVGDAPADPLAGLRAAGAARALIDAGRGGVVDVSMRDGIAAALTVDRYPAEIQEVA